MTTHHLHALADFIASGERYGLPEVVGASVLRADLDIQIRTAGELDDWAAYCEAEVVEEPGKQPGFVTADPESGLRVRFYAPSDVALVSVPCPCGCGLTEEMPA